MLAWGENSGLADMICDMIEIRKGIVGFMLWFLMCGVVMGSDVTVRVNRTKSEDDGDGVHDSC